MDKKKKTIWEIVAAVFLVFVGALGLGLFILLILIMFNEYVECWVKEVLGVGRKKDAIQFIAWCIGGTVPIWVGMFIFSRQDATQVEK